jgi:hypothetical protein
VAILIIYHRKGKVNHFGLFESGDSSSGLINPYYDAKSKFMNNAIYPITICILNTPFLGKIGKVIKIIGVEPVSGEILKVPNIHTAIRDP